MGQTAAELILEKINKPQAPNRTVVLDAEMKLQASTENPLPKV
jgi:DNA-binding LacI/PurR family transcriptional regulator